LFAAFGVLIYVSDMKAICGYCGKEFEMLTGAYNRAMKNGMRVFCSRKHSGLARRVKRSKKEKKELKRIYDSQYRVVNADKLRNKKQEYFKKDYSAHPRKYRNWRKRKQKWQNEYCRQPEYRKWKKEYDRSYRAKKYYGPMADAFLAWLDLKNFIDNRFAKQQNELTNKSQKRKRSCQRQTPKQNLSSLLRA